MCSANGDDAGTNNSSVQCAARARDVQAVFLCPSFTQWLSQVSVSASSGAEMISWRERNSSSCVDAISPVLAWRMEMLQRGVFSLCLCLVLRSQGNLCRRKGKYLLNDESVAIGCANDLQVRRKIEILMV